MITYRLGIYHQDLKAAKDFASAVKRRKGSCDTVWLITDHYFPTLERHKRYAENWLAAAEVFKDAGLEVSIQTAQTFGHGDPSNPLAPDRIAGMTNEKGEVVDLMVGPDGRKNTACFCWRGRSYIEYMKKMLAVYAEVLKPHRFWLDDDVRAFNHYPNRYGCFCEGCIEKFNRLWNTDFDRESLVLAINGDLAVRERFVEFNRKGVYDFVYEVTKAILAVSPDTAMGYEFGHFSLYCGNDVSYVFDAFRDAGAKAIHARPGAGHYNDKEPYGQFVKAFDLARENSITPDYVESMDAELENLPGVLYGKSVGGIVNECVLDLASGCTGLTLTDVQSMHEPIEYYERIFAALSGARPYFDKLSSVSRKGVRGGACVYQSERSFAVLRADEEPFGWAEGYCTEKDIPFTRLGIPFSFDNRKASSYILRSGELDAMSDGEIEFILSKPVLTDGDAVKKIIDRGFGEYFGIVPVATEERGFERFTQDPINGKYAGLFFEENPYSSTPMPHYVFQGLSENDRAVGVLQHSHVFSDGLDVGACTAITEVGKPNGKKVKWAIFGYSLWCDITSGAKRGQILGALDEISPLPAKLISEEIAALYLSVDEEGRLLSATVAAASQNGTGELELVVRAPAGTRAELMSAKNAPTPIPLEKNESGSYTVKIPPLAPYGIATLFFTQSYKM